MIMKYERPIINISMFDIERIAADGQDLLVASGQVNNVQMAQNAAINKFVSYPNAQKALGVIQFNQ